VREEAVSEASALELARAQERQLVRLRQSQEESCLCKNSFPMVFAALWGLEEDDVRNCLDFDQCIHQAVEWVQELESDLIKQSTSRFAAELQACLRMLHYWDTIFNCSHLS
jgi:hypothetical protein